MDDVKKKLKTDEYRNWVKSTLGLERTNRALYEYVKAKFVVFTHERPPPPPPPPSPPPPVQGQRFTEDIYNHIHPGTGCIRRNLMGKTKYIKNNNTWEFKYKCDKCKGAFKTILSLHANATEKGIHWKNCHDTSNDSLEWAIAKIFLPEGNHNTTGPEDIDIAAMITLMLNCTLFLNPIKQGNLKPLREARNRLFHSPNNMVNNKEVIKYFFDMNEVLRHASHDNDVDENIRKTIKEDKKKLKELKEAEVTMTLFDDALKLKRKAIYDDFEKCLSDNDIEQLKVLLKLAENVAADLQLMNDHKDELKNIKGYKDEIERLRTKDNHIKTEIKKKYKITKTIQDSHVEFKREVQSMLDEYRKVESSYIKENFKSFEQNLRHQNEIVNRMREQVTLLSGDLNQLQQVPNDISVFTQGIMRLKIGACFCWQSVRDAVDRLDAEGLMIIVIITIGLTILFRMFFA